MREMVLVFIALLIAVPLAELYVIFQVAHQIGALETVVVLILVSVIGGWLVRRVGLGILARSMKQLAEGRMPTDEMINGGLVLVAGATGFAPVKSMVEHAFHIKMKRRIILYWGVRSRKDLYLAELPRRWAAEHANFTFVPVLSDAKPEDEWTGRTGLVHEAILADFPDLTGYQIYACGSAKMVEAAHPAFQAHGLAQDDCFSDAFKLAPHRVRTMEDADMVKLGGAD